MFWNNKKKKQDVKNDYSNNNTIHSTDNRIQSSPDTMTWDVYHPPFEGIDSYDEYIQYANSIDGIETHPHTNVINNSFEYFDEEDQTYKAGILYYVGSQWLVIGADGSKMWSYIAEFKYYEVQDIEYFGKSSVLVNNDHIFHFKYAKYRRDFLKYVNDYNTFIDDMIESVQKKSEEIFGNLVVDPEITNAIQNFLNMVPEIVFIDVNLYRGYLHYFCFGSIITKKYINFSEEDEQMAIEMISKDGNQEAFQELWGLTTNLMNLLMEHFGIDEYCVYLVTYLLINHGLIYRFSQIWLDNYDNEAIPENWRNYIHECLNNNILMQEDYKGITALTYRLIQDDSENRYIFRKKYDEVFNEFVNAINNKRKDDFASMLFQHNDSKTTYITMDDIDLMTGSEFETFICRLFQNMGYKATITKTSGDQGIDVLAEQSGFKIGIQAKCYSGKVGNSAIQETVAGINFYHCNKGIVVTNSYFTDAAIKLANANNIILWNRDILKEKIQSYRIENTR